MASKFTRSLVGMLVAASTFMGAFSLAAVGSRPAAAADAMAEVRVVHASPDAPAVDVYLNGAKAISSLAFGQASPIASVPAGSYDVKVTAAGATDAVISAKLDLSGGTKYSVVAVGKLANISAQVIAEPVTTAGTKALVRVVHASPDAPAVDVAVTGGPVLISGLAFPKSSDLLSVDAGSYDLEVRPAGTTTAVLSAPGTKLEAGMEYTIFAIGLVGGAPALTLLPVADALPAAGTPPAGMPQTGAADGFALGVLALLLLAVATITTGVAVRVRNR